MRNHVCSKCMQWCSGSGAPLQFLFHLFLVKFAYILQNLASNLIITGKLPSHMK